MSSSSDDPMPPRPRALRKRFAHQAKYPQNPPPNDTEYQPDRATRVRPGMPKDFTAHEGPRIFKIEDALLLYNPAVNPDTCFTEKFRKGDTIHEEFTVHLAINGKRPRTADECKTFKVLKAPWGNLFHRWTIEKDGARYFVKLINGRWRPWMGKIRGLSRNAIAFPVEVRIQGIYVMTRACVFDSLRTFVPDNLPLLFPLHLQTAIHPTCQLLNREWGTQIHQST